MHIELDVLLQGWPVLLKNKTDRKFLQDQYPWILRRHNSRIWPQCRFPREFIDETDPLRKLAPFEDHIFPPIAFAVLAKSIVPGLASFSIQPLVDETTYGPVVNIKLARENGGIINGYYELPFDDCEWADNMDRVRISFRQQRPYKTILGLNWVSKAEVPQYFDRNDAWFYQTFEANLKVLLSENRREMEQMECEGDGFVEKLWKTSPSGV